MLDDQPNCHKVLDQHIWREIEIRMAHFKLRGNFLLYMLYLSFSKTIKNSTKEKENAQLLAKRKQQGLYVTIRELSLEDTKGFKEMMRMGPDQFKEILSLIERNISKQHTMMGGEPICAAERLALTIRFLATGESYHSLHFQFRISRCAISYIITEVCKAIAKVLGPPHLKVPSKREEWLKIAEQLEVRWNFPNCIGAIDGKHVIIQAPSNSGSHYFNYKRTYSIILMAIAGPDYEVLYADVGTNGRVADGGVWNKCSFLKSMEEGNLEIPESKPLPGGKQLMPYVIVGDDAFALNNFMMKPYPQKN